MQTDHDVHTDQKGGVLRYEERISQREIELIKYRDNRTMLTVKLITGEILEGAVRWYDSQCLHLIQPDRSELTLYIQAIAFYRPRL